MTDRIARLRVRSVRMKNGGASIRVLRGEDQNHTLNVMKRVEQCLSAQGSDVAGFAFVVWGKEQDSTCDAANYCSPIPHILIPDFVRNRLLAERIVDWAVEQVKKQ